VLDLPKTTEPQRHPQKPQPPKHHIVREGASFTLKNFRQPVRKPA
jgi:hypothetical protein